MTDPISNERLLPCPFCGNAERPSLGPYTGEPYFPGFIVQCDAYGFDGDPAKGCGAATGWCGSEAEAIAAWNRRQSPAGSDTAMRGGSDCDWPQCGCCFDAKCSDAPLSVEPAGAEPVAWQRRLKYSDVAGAVPQWQNCSAAEATGHFENSPYHEYRSLYASPPKAVTITDEDDRPKKAALWMLTKVIEEAERLGPKAEPVAVNNIVYYVSQAIAALSSEGLSNG